MNREPQVYCFSDFRKSQRQPRCNAPWPSYSGLAGDIPACEVAYFSGGAQCDSPQPLPLTLRVLEAIPPRPEIHLPAEETVAPHPRRKRTGSNPVEGNRHKTVIDWASGSGPVATSGAHRTPDTRTDDEPTPLPRNGRGVAASRSPLSHRPTNSQPELGLSEHKRLCERCGKREIYLDIKTMDLCEPCIWEIVQEDQ